VWSEQCKRVHTGPTPQQYHREHDMPGITIGQKFIMTGGEGPHVWKVTKEREGGVEAYHRMRRWMVRMVGVANSGYCSELRCDTYGLPQFLLNRALASVFMAISVGGDRIS
jgi:hypothetical protein